MRIFVFLLMLAIASGGTLGGYRLITGKDLVTLDQLDFGRGAVNAEAISTVTPVPSPAAVSTVPPLATPVPPTPTPVPEQARAMVVANTDGHGVYLRRGPKLDDRVRAWVEGTRMDATGAPVSGDGVEWLKVRAPDGTEGYVPSQYLSPAP